MTADSEKFGDRHLRKDPGRRLRDVPAHEDATVCLVVSPHAANTDVGQLGAWLAINLLSRLDGLVKHLQVVSPAAPVLEPLTRLRLPTPAAPPVARTDLASELVELSGRIAGSRLIAAHAPEARASDFTIVIGGAETPSLNAQDRTVWCFGKGWLSFAGCAPETPIPDLSCSSNPLGMFFAVCIAVGELFKGLRGLDQSQTGILRSVYASLWAGETAGNWATLVDGPDPQACTLAPTNMVGAGAVAQAALLAVGLSTAGIRYLTSIDNDKLDRLNRNRYVLTFRDHEGIEKPAHVAAFLRSFHIPVAARFQPWVEYAADPRPDPSNPHGHAERDAKFALVLSCVDTNLARNEIQRFWPRDVIGASTDGRRSGLHGVRRPLGRWQSIQRNDS